MNGIHRTEVDGVEAVWRWALHRLEILSVRNAADGTAVATFETGRHPDLASAREFLPEFTPLWDAVRHQFWTAFKGGGA
ncbi:hypothetical protein [Nocardia sp. NPDC051570]|uniref:hypothetical protein n=1 Tax=Nocardia sp. NPDC051570 TaxID=3364324 RepID=UPI0037B582D3